MPGATRRCGFHRLIVPIHNECRLEGKPELQDLWSGYGRIFHHLIGRHEKSGLPNLCLRFQTADSIRNGAMRLSFSKHRGKGAVAR
jgi:hypothetical protein